MPTLYYFPSSWIQNKSMAGDLRVEPGISTALHLKRSAFSLKQALSCFLARSRSPAPVFTPLWGSSLRGMNLNSPSGMGRRGSYSPMGDSNSSLLKRVSSEIECTFGRSCCSLTRVGFDSSRANVTLLAGRAPVSTMIFPLEAT